ncbi:hypothetical protein [Kaarinaea lacus]
MSAVKTVKHQQVSLVNIYSKPSFWWFLVSILVLGCGLFLAARQYPGGFDWVYTVVSALASQKHNPEGSIWFAGSFGLSMALLWPYVTFLKKNLCPFLPPKAEIAISVLRIGLVCGMLLGLERLLIHDLSAWVYKAHELLGLLAFMGFYLGLLGLLIQVMLRQRIYALPVLFVASPLVAIGITQLWLYVNQRDLGWVDTSWREMGIPFWLSFAFWQWLAIVFLGMGLLLLSFTRLEKNR